jgi:anaerobic ribonucleoside-triphosphate reductase
MNDLRGTDTPEEVLKFASKPKEDAQLDNAGNAIVTKIRTAADLAHEDCDRAMSLAHKLSMELRAGEDRTHQLEAEVELWRDQAMRAEHWLRIIQQEIEEKLIERKSSSTSEQTSSP